MNWTTKLFSFKILGILLFTGLLLVGCRKTRESKKKQSRVDTLPFYKEAIFTPNWLNAISDTSLT